MHAGFGLVEEDPVRKATEETRAAIRDAALARFRTHGYPGATLQQIGDQVGLTRGAVLHHFNSKAELLAAVVQPCITAFDELLASAGYAPEAVERQRLLRQFANLVLDHRATVELLVGDVGARDALDPADAWTARIRRLAVVLAGTYASPARQARTAAALGAIIYPVASAWLDLDGFDARVALVEAGLAAIGPQAAVPEGAAILTGRS